MPRPQRSRKICKEPVFAEFSPDARPDADVVVLTVDEFETLRLVDLEKLTQALQGLSADLRRSAEESRKEDDR